MTPAQRSVGILVLSSATVLGSLALTRATSAPEKLQRATAVTPAPVAIHLSATLESSHVLRGLSDTHMIVRIKAPADPGTERPPVSLGVVLDRSGSMHGEKLDQAKRAAVELVSALDERDRFSFTIYGTEVRTLIRLTPASGEAKRRAIDVINGITDDGGTNLSGGMLAGRAELERTLADEAGVRRVVLISDGRANEGVVFRDQLAELARQTAERGISITTVGVGLDFEEQTMTAIAVAGRGNYYYAERARDLSDMFTTELGRVARTTATDVVLTFDPAPGVEIVEAYGYALRGNTVEVADLHAGEERVVVLRLAVRSQVVGAAPVASIALSMTDPTTGEAIDERVAVTTEITDDHQAVARGQLPDAVRVVERAQTARALQSATELYEKGDTAGARRLLDTRRTEVRRRAAAIGDAKLAEEIDGVAAEAEKNLAPPSPASSAGKAGRKRNRKAAYDLLY